MGLFEDQVIVLKQNNPCSKHKETELLFRQEEPAMKSIPIGH